MFYLPQNLSPMFSCAPLLSRAFGGLPWPPGWRPCFCCGKTHIIGGSDPSVLADNDQYQTSGDSWSSLTNLPSPSRTNLAAGTVSATIYCTSGNDGVAPRLQDNDSYVEDTWTGKTDTPAPARDVAPSAAVSGKLYIFGGATGAAPDPNLDNDEYDPSGNSWTSKTDLPTPARRNASSFTVTTYGFCVAGNKATGAPVAADYLVDNDRYDPSGDSWSARTDLSTPARDFAAGAEMSDFGYIIGGKDLTTEAYADTDRFDDTGNSWAAKTDLNTARATLAAAFSGSAIYATCGRDIISASQRTNEEFVEDTWTAKTDTPTPARAGHGMASLT